MRRHHQPAFEPFLACPIGPQQLGDWLDRRLLRQYVKAGGGDMAVAHQLGQRVEIKDRAASIVDDDSPLAQQPQLVATVSECIGVTTNNVAEYRALIAGLEAVAHLHAEVIHVRADSLLIIKQLRGEWKVKHANMRPLHEEARSLLAAYSVVDLQHVPRAENTEADTLVNAALDAS